MDETFTTLENSNNSSKRAETIALVACGLAAVAIGIGIGNHIDNRGMAREIIRIFDLKPVPKA